MDRIASFLRRKICDIKIDPRLRRGLWLARVFVIAYQKLARPEDVERVLVENVFGSRPPTNVEGQGIQRGARRKKFAARMGLEQERCGQHKRSHNSEAK